MKCCTKQSVGNHVF